MFILSQTPMAKKLSNLTMFQGKGKMCHKAT